MFIVNEKVKLVTIQYPVFIRSIKTVYAMPTMTFSFVCHTAVLPIFAELRR